MSFVERIISTELMTTDNQNQIGGLSGKPLFPYALEALKTLRPLLPPSTPIIGCGGITTGSDAVKMAQSGASLVQVYTLFGYRGVGTPRLLKDEVSRELKGRSWKTVIGSDWKGGEMGWDEKRLEKESETLKNEAKGLGDLLRHLNEKEGLQRLIAEAEAAIKKPIEAARPAAPRDNNLGAQKDNDSGTQKTPTAIKDVSPDVGNQLQQAIESAIETPRERRGTPTRAIEAPSAQEDIPGVPATPSNDNEFFRRAQSGDRRLV